MVQLQHEARVIRYLEPKSTSSYREDNEVSS